MSITRIGAMLLVVGLAVGVVSGFGIGFTFYQPQMSQLESDLSTTESELTEAQNNITSMQGNITSLQGNITCMQGNITSLQANVSSLETQLEETQAKLMPGRVPILHVGDWWTMEFVYNETAYNMTEEVTGEDVDCYRMYMAFSSPYQGQINRTYCTDKSTLSPVRMQGHANYTYDTTTVPYTYNATILQTYQGGVLFPFIVGKKLNMSEMMTYNMTMSGSNYTYIMNSSYTVEVEAIENVTVPAGTFTCFKIVMRNATTGDLFYATWFSDEAKYYVKYVDYSTTPATTFELKDYFI